MIIDPHGDYKPYLKVLYSKLQLVAIQISVIGEEREGEDCESARKRVEKLQELRSKMHYLKCIVGMSRFVLYSPANKHLN